MKKEGPVSSLHDKLYTQPHQKVTFVQGVPAFGAGTRVRPVFLVLEG